jgi:predicted XRE-type DNA-binding protein
MTPPLNKIQLKILNIEFYENKNLFGRDKLFTLLKQKYENEAPSRRQIAEWLKLQEINQLYTPSKGKPKDIKSSMTTPHKILAIDLVDLQKFQVKGFKYLLNGIDMSSRFIYSQAMKNKTDAEVLTAFKKILKKAQIKAIRSDNGSEFINKKFKDFLTEKKIKQIFSEAGKPQSNGMIERSNATIKELIQKSLELNEKFDWPKNLQKLIDNINNSQHRITGFTPNQIQEAYEKNDKGVLEEAYNKELKKKGSNISKEIYNVGDFVRIHEPSDKTRQVWSNEIYEIEKVIKPIKSYSVYEYKLKEFKDRFKEEELLKIEGEPQNKIIKVNKFVISKLIKPVIKNNVAFYEVQWKGYKEHTIEPRETLLKDVPKMVNQFEKKTQLKFYVNTNKKTGAKTTRFYFNESDTK